MTIEGKRVVDQSLDFNKLQFEIHRCMFDNMGYIDPAKEKLTHTVRIAADRSLYSYVRVTKNEFFGRYATGSMSLAFKPRSGGRYKLVYAEKKNSFFIDLYYYHQASQSCKLERMSRGFSYWPRC